MSLHIVHVLRLYWEDCAQICLRSSGWQIIPKHYASLVESSHIDMEFASEQCSQTHLTSL